MTDCSDAESSIITEDSFSDLSEYIDSSDIDSDQTEEDYDVNIRCERCNTLIETFYRDCEPEVYVRIIQIITNQWLEMMLYHGIQEPGYHLCPRCRR